MTSYNRHTLDTSQQLTIANIGNRTSDRGKSLYQIPHPYTKFT